MCCEYTWGAKHALACNVLQASVAVAYQKAESELEAQQHPDGGVIVVCGSLHAVADAQKILDL